MKRRFILYRRKLGGTFYVEDTETRKQESLGTKNRAEVTSLLNARNESVRQPQLNLQIAKAYLAGTDSGVATRTWQQALDAELGPCWVDRFLFHPCLVAGSKRQPNTFFVQAVGGL